MEYQPRKRVRWYGQYTVFLTGFGWAMRGNDDISHRARQQVTR